MPHAQLYFFAQIVVSLTRLTADDVYMTTTPLFHGNAQFMAAYPALVAGARFVLRPKFSASRWIDHVRESGVTVTNFVGVMMDFAWKQPPREDDPTTSCAASSPPRPPARSVDGVQGALRHRGVRRRLRPDRDLRADHVALRRGAARRARPGCRTRSGSTSGWSTPRPTARSPVGEVGELVVRPKHAVDMLQRLLQHAGEDRRGVAQPLVPHRRRAAPRRGRLVLLRRPLQGRPPPPRREHQLLRGRAGDPRPPRRRRVRRHRRAGRPGGRRGRGAGLSSSPPRRGRAPPRSWPGATGRIPAFAVPRYLARGRRRCRRRRRRRSARPCCARTASPPTPTTARPAETNGEHHDHDDAVRAAPDAGLGARDPHAADRRPRRRAAGRDLGRGQPGHRGGHRHRRRCDGRRRSTRPWRPPAARSPRGPRSRARSARGTSTASPTSWRRRPTGCCPRSSTRSARRSPSRSTCRSRWPSRSTCAGRRRRRRSTARSTSAATTSRPDESDVVHEPVGVVAAITGYNYPLNLAIFKFGAALAAGLHGRPAALAAHPAHHAAARRPDPGGRACRPAS